MRWLLTSNNQGKKSNIIKMINYLLIKIKSMEKKNKDSRLLNILDVFKEKYLPYQQFGVLSHVLLSLTIIDT